MKAPSGFDRLPERMAILEIDSTRLEEERLYPDEQFIQHLIQQRCGEDWRAREDWRAIWKEIAERTDWRASLEGLGTCSHFGLVPNATITRVAFFDSASNPDIHELLPEEVSIDAHAVCGRAYQNLTRWFFKDASLSVDDLMRRPPADCPRALRSVLEQERADVERMMRRQHGIEVIQMCGEIHENER